MDMSRKMIYELTVKVIALSSPLSFNTARHLEAHAWTSVRDVQMVSS